MKKVHGYLVKNNDLWIGNHKASDLAKQFKTPLYVMDEARIRSQMRLFKNSFKDDEIQTQVAYASKAFLTQAMVQVVDEEGLYLDVVSGGELYTALSVGFDPKKLIFHGNNKSLEELSYALESKVGLIVIDNEAEFERIEYLKPVHKVNVLLRVNVGVEAHTHKYIQTTTLDSKFGVSIFDLETQCLIQKMMASSFIHLKGLHTHIGSQITSSEYFYEELEVFFKHLSLFKSFGFNCELLNLGGGFGVQYLETDPVLNLEDSLKTLLKKAKELSSFYQIKIPSLMIEPGRSIVAEAGITLYTVGSIKKTPHKNFVFVDGSMADGIRAALYQAKYDAVLINRAEEVKTTTYTVAGKACESGDILIDELMLPEVIQDDLLAVFSTGAYHYSMASNYNRLTKPAVIFVNGDKVKVVVERENFADLIRNDRGIK